MCQYNAPMISELTQSSPLDFPRENLSLGSKFQSFTSFTPDGTVKVIFSPWLKEYRLILNEISVNLGSSDPTGACS